jgi:hypothetical protein
MSTLFGFAKQSLLIEPRLENQVRAEDDEQERAAEIELEDHLGKTADQGSRHSPQLHNSHENAVANWKEFK